MTESLEQRIIEIIQQTLKDSGAEQDLVISGNDSMETVASWDSLRFMSVFMAINEAFDIDPDFDDAINYTSVKGLQAFLTERTT